MSDDARGRDPQSAGQPIADRSARTWRDTEPGRAIDDDSGGEAPLDDALADRSHRTQPDSYAELSEALDPRGPTLAQAMASDEPEPPTHAGFDVKTDAEISVRRSSVSSPGPAPLAPGTRVGDYEIEQKIGEGAMSEVYRAIHPTIGRRVAIKLISPKLFDDSDAEARFLREARTVASIHHPTIVDVFGFGALPDGRVYLIMEWLAGRSLAARLQTGALPAALAGDLLLQITSALRAAHEKGIVHRDLKPENVFLVEHADEKPVVKLLDFGLAKRAGDDVPSTTPTGQLLGTPLYMSPEQARGLTVDHRTDIYALGCIAYQLYTGRPPFECDGVEDLLAAHLAEPPPPPRSRAPELPAVLDTLLLEMLAKDPEHRPPLPRVRRAIQSVLGIGSAPMPVVEAPAVVSTPSEPPPAAESVPAPARASRIPLVVLVIVALVAALAISLWVRG